ncbi:MAG: ATP-dependent 6-phosphofructokinase [Alphaproteobacteria bacterium]|jgi:phosphofructokinase-like protein|nr:ATP-dependent 6-phosphofructokinase [Alphaproteobacteria bacterium]MBP9878158.1 ATP-dependent 6-phosphofructokinase [Alphaproteobacteria bacterium]
MVKRIAVLTSGGDCAGLNAALRGIVQRATLKYGWEIIGILQGTAGLLTTPPLIEKLNPAKVDSTIFRQGGTILGTTNKGDPFHYTMPDGSIKDRSDEIVNALHDLKIDALIGIGGDGSLKILSGLMKKAGINLIGIPKTIDNDIGLTERSIGFETAVDVATEALDRLQPTAASHARVMVLEVMGRDAGHIALSAGIAGGADIILIPEIPFTLDGIAQKIREIKNNGRNFALVVVSEAVRTVEGRELIVEYPNGERRLGGIGQYIGSQIEKLTKAETRVISLGHVQRGGPPIPSDRLLAASFGVHAVDCIAEGIEHHMVAWSDRKMIHVPIASAIQNYQCVEMSSPLLKTALGLGIYLGEVQEE